MHSHQVVLANSPLDTVPEENASAVRRSVHALRPPLMQKAWHTQTQQRQTIRPHRSPAAGGLQDTCTESCSLPAQSCAGDAAAYLHKVLQSTCTKSCRLPAQSPAVDAADAAPEWLGRGQQKKPGRYPVIQATAR
eukprot:scaffold100761_cov22-Tisochrysis_lutea.AAC.2